MKKTHGVDGRLASALAFLLPALLAAGVFAWLGIYPFGGKTLLVADLDGEYIDYLAQLHRVVRGKGSLLRSWSMGMGLGQLGLIAFYAASPLNLLIFLSPLEWITEAVFIVLLLKIGLSGLAFSHFARRAVGLSPWISVAFAVAYGLCAYNIAYSSNIMWLDGVAVLPLAVLGVHGLLEEKRCGLLLGSLVYAFFTSYYIGYMIGVFCLLYLSAGWFGRRDSWREYADRVLRLAGCGALAAGCCAFLLLPAYLGLAHGQDAMWSAASFPPLTLARPLTPALAKLLPGSFDTLTDQGTANLYCSLAALGGAVLYFFNNSIARREKLANLCLLLVALFSLASPFLYLGWHAFEDPTWFPARFSFVWSFWLLSLAARCMVKREGCGPLGIGAALLCILLILAEAAGADYSSPAPAWRRAAFGLAALYALLAIAAGRRPLRCKWWQSALAVLVCLECAGSMAQTVQEIDRRFHYQSRESYMGFREQYEPAVRAVQEMDKGVYRMEVVEQRSANSAMMLGYRSISHYSTTTDQALNSLLRQMGYNTGTINQLHFAPNTPLANGLLGVRYVLGREPMAGYETIQVGEGAAVSYNPLFMPLATGADSQVLQFDPQAYGDPFEMQNRWVAAVSGQQRACLVPAQAREQLYGVTREERDGYTLYRRTPGAAEAVVEWTVANPAGAEVYAYLPVYGRNFARAEVETAGGRQRELAYRRNTVQHLGNSDEVTLRLILLSDEAHIRSSYFYALDAEAAGEAAAVSAQRQLQITRFTDTRVEGTIDMEADGALVTTFPYDKGWRVRINGRRAGITRFAGVFLAVELEAGQHMVQMRYLPPGFGAGAVVSLLSWEGVAVWQVRKRRLSLDKKRGAR